MKQENFDDGMVTRYYNIRELHPDVQEAIKKSALGSAQIESNGGYLDLITMGDSAFKIIFKIKERSDKRGQRTVA